MIGDNIWRRGIILFVMMLVLSGTASSNHREIREELSGWLRNSIQGNGNDDVLSWSDKLLIGTLTSLNPSDIENLLACMRAADDAKSDAAIQCKYQKIVLNIPPDEENCELTFKTAEIEPKANFGGINRNDPQGSIEKMLKDNWACTFKDGKATWGVLKVTCVWDLECYPKPEETQEDPEIPQGDEYSSDQFQRTQEIIEQIYEIILPLKEEDLQTTPTS